MNAEREGARAERRQSANTCQTERAGYFSVPGAEIYTVLHQAAEPVARVLLVGPFAHERHSSYHPWVRWARFLAQKQFEVLRFDYRGVGESTGVFGQFSFSDWLEDARLLAQWLASRSPRLPLLIHGLEIGALLARACFDAGHGNALLLWSPPRSANQALRDSLRYWTGLQQLYESPEKRRPAGDYIRILQEGGSIEIDGYSWSSRLWRDSFNIVLSDTTSREYVTCAPDKNSVRAVKLSKDAAPLVRPYLRYDAVPDLSFLYEENFQWIADITAYCTGELGERNDRNT